MSDSETVEFMDADDETVALIDDEAYRLSSGDVQLHPQPENNELVILTADEYYVADIDENGWLILPEDTPTFVQEYISSETNKRFSDADIQDFPLEISFGYRNENVLENAAWRNEVIRPETDLIKSLPNIRTVSFEGHIHEDGTLTITDMKFRPSRPASKVEFDL